MTTTKWNIKIVRHGAYKVSRPVPANEKPRPYYVFPDEGRCTCKGWQKWKHCAHLTAAVAFKQAVERAKREAEDARRRRERGVSEWAREFLWA